MEYPGLEQSASHFVELHLSLWFWSCFVVRCDTVQQCVRFFLLMPAGPFNYIKQRNACKYLISIWPRNVYRTHWPKAEDLTGRLANNAKGRASEFNVSTGSRMMRLSGNVTRMGEIRNLSRKTVGKKSQRKITFKWEDSICSESWKTSC
jgi:hypothetical protein